jgi:hypothetical protein
MKRSIITLALGLAFAGAMADRPSRFTFIASPQLSWMNSDLNEIENFKNNIGFNYGVETDIFLGSENYALLTGFTINHTGGSLIYNTDESFEYADKELPPGTRIKGNINYFEVPLALKLRSTEFGRINFFTQFGITNWFNLKSKGTSNDGTLKDNDVNGEFRFYNIALNVGIGIEYNVSKNNAITCGAVYNNGLLDITSNSILVDNTNLKIVRLRLGFIF